jgi:hypothetical protein
VRGQHGRYRATHRGVIQRRPDPEEITTEVPHLSLTQSYAALTSSHANREDMAADITMEENEDPMRQALVHALRVCGIDVRTALGAARNGIDCLACGPREQ